MKILSYRALWSVGTGNYKGMVLEINFLCSDLITGKEVVGGKVGTSYLSGLYHGS